MAEIGDKSFTTDLVQEIKKAVIAELGTNAFVNRYLATVSAVDTATSDITVYLSGSSDAFSGFRARGLQLPVINDQVIACIDGQDRWIESVVRPATSTPFLQISSGALVGAGLPTGAITAYSGTTAPSGWLMCDGSAVSRTTYSGLFAVIGTKAGVGDNSTTFNLPDLKDRFLAGNLATSTGYAQNGGGLTPNAAMSAPAHTHTQGAHGHTFTGTGATHAHDIAKAAIAGAVNVISFTGTGNTSLSGAVAPAAPATGAQFNQSGTTITHDHNLTNSDLTHDHGVNSTANESDATSNSTSVTPAGTIDSISATASGAATATSIGTPKAGLVNFIIKT
jgi:microcystin-dependent protein